ncbi:DUF4189 domain-containing protein [Chitinolyticbacter meiyuanensis]|uniref:DUF4189 domain-containing protein n=1 Tax=Chitinolyticbacter meiyuanensis TaxID=682798 RepID=UPI001651E02A|nr:DUF4189 domain-containing protein [Chitinolyticbacter meiyuanensis]
MSVEGDVFLGNTWNSATKAEAEASALAACREEARKALGPKAELKCKILATYPGPGYLAVAKSANQSGFSYVFHVEQQTAVDLAAEKCTATFGQCNEHVSWFYDSVGVANNGKPQAKAKQCQPPTGRAVRFDETCNNGDCIRTFENGCSIHFQAAYCYDPIKQAWGWNSDGC